jgi:hypothetical protein
VASGSPQVSSQGAEPHIRPWQAEGAKFPQLSRHRATSAQVVGTQQHLAADEPQVSRQPPGWFGSHSTPAQRAEPATPQSSTQVSG